MRKSGPDVCYAHADEINVMRKIFAGHHKGR